MTDTLESSACFVVFLCVSWFAAVVMARPFSQIVAASCCLLPEFAALICEVFWKCARDY